MRSASSPPSLSGLVMHHLVRQGGDGERLITVNHQPQGPVAYQITGDDELSIIGMESIGGVVHVHAQNVNYGRCVFVLNGPVVTEIVLHETQQQADDYRTYAATVAAEHEQIAADMIGSDDGAEA